ncbi:hypothetical protein GGR53DRAFT_22481 [Hypoxylon sp. FL1150]|nr:hypothetical protein GGR53DRAFT_22481 [Hypoxylon sp. FL1150]
MRLDVSIFRTLACLAGLVAAQAQDSDDRSTRGVSTDSGATATTTSSSNSVIEVEALPTTYPVYTPKNGNQTITYSKGSGITNLTVTAVNLKRFDDNTTIAEGVIDTTTGISTSTSTTSTGVGALFHSDEGAVGRREGPSPLPPFKFPMTDDSLVLIVSSDLDEYGNNIGRPLYYEFQWENSTSKGTSYSQLIAVATDSDTQSAIDAIKESGKETSPAFSEVITDDSSSSDDPTSSATAPTPAAETSAEVAASQSSSGGGGLSTGAIAGIAVGCVIAGLLIIGFLAWFCFFRRRGSRQRVRGTDFAADSGTHAMMPDKEAVAMSQSSPHSAFADDGGRLHDPQRRSAAPGGDGASSAPYSDRARSTSPPAGGAALPTAVHNHSQTDVANTSRPPSPPFNSRYAHLIEEGMTEDEIRRLEEEERHLDAAIEDAGRNSRLTHQS